MGVLPATSAAWLMIRALALTMAWISAVLSACGAATAALASAWLRAASHWLSETPAGSVHCTPAVVNVARVGAGVLLLSVLLSA